MIFEVLDTYATMDKCFDTVCCLYATAPFVDGLKLQKAYQLLSDFEFDSAYPVVAFSYPIQRGLVLAKNKLSMVNPEYLNKRTQDLQVIYHDAGQFYISGTNILKQTGSFLGKNTGGILFSELEVQDLDTETDWKLAELKYQLLHAE